MSGPIRPGIGNTNSYLVSGIPYVTGTTILSSSFGTKNSQYTVTFPYVTRSITVINTSDTDLRIHFNDIDDGNVIGGHHYLTLGNNGSNTTLDVKCTELYISLVNSGSNGSFELFAELTHISRREMFDLTGSGLTD